MKKRFLLLIPILAVLACSTLFGAVAFAETVQTEIALPSSYVEYFDLKCPVDIAFGQGRFAILENDERSPSDNRLILNDGEKYVVYDLSDYDATEIRFYGENILFLSNSRIYLFDCATETATDTGMVAATSFSISGNTVLTNTSSGLDVYSADLEGGAPTFTRSYSVSLQYSPETVVLTNENTAYYFFNKKIYSYNLNTKQSAEGADFAGDARYSTYSGGYVYFSMSIGIYRFDENFNLKQINQTPSSNVQGIAINDGKLYACYKDEKAVNEVAIDSQNSFVDNFTLFSITYDGDRINRINKTVKRADYAGEKLFVLDGTKLKRADLINEDYAEFELAGLIDNASSVTDFATDGDTALFIETLIGGDTKLHLIKFTESGVSEIAGFTEFTSVTAIDVYENEYYFINNKTNVSRQYAEVTRLYHQGTNWENLENCESETVFSPEGTGWELDIDIFGEIYVSAFLNGEYFITSSERGELINTAQAAKSIFVDFDGKVYYALDDGAVYRFDGENTVNYSPLLWENAPLDATLNDLIPTDNGSFYLLYNGFVLKTVSDMGVSTPENVPLPDDFEIEYNDGFEIVSLKENGKLFEVSLLELGGEYFEYLGYKTYSPEKSLVVVGEFSKYAVLADDKGAYLARTADISARATQDFTAVDRQMYITNNLFGYALPVIERPFNKFDLHTNDSVTVVSEFEFNGVSYSLINYGNQAGYIPSAFLKPAVADAAFYTVYSKSIVGQRGATIYSDEELLLPVGSLDYGDTVYVVEENGGVAKIAFDGDFYFVAKKDLNTRSYYAIRNLLVILVLVVAVLSSTYFILRTRVFKRKEK